VRQPALGNRRTRRQQRLRGDLPAVERIAVVEHGIGPEQILVHRLHIQQLHDVHCRSIETDRVAPRHRLSLLRHQEASSGMYSSSIFPAANTAFARAAGSKNHIQRLDS
jgi:hypothetical protein